MDAERALVTKVALSGKGAAELTADGVVDDHFIHEDCLAAWRFITKHTARYGKQPTAKTILEAIPTLNFEPSDESLEFIRDEFGAALGRREAITWFREDFGPATNDPDRVGSLEQIIREGADRVAAMPLGGGPGRGRAELIGMDTVDAEATRWLWTGFIPLRALTVLAADPKVGKGLLSIWLAAQITQGRRGWEKRTVAFLGHEDALGIQKARLDAAGADSSRVKSLRGRDNAILTLPRDAQEIERLIVEYDIGCLFIDPINSHVDADINSNSDKEMRRALSPLALLSQKCNCIIIVVHHFSKGTIGGKLLYRVGGAMAYSGVARSVLALGRKEKDEEAVELDGDGTDYIGRPDSEDDDSDARFLFQTGQSYAKDPNPIRFEIVTAKVKVTLTNGALEGMSPASLQARAGHSSYSVTQRYVALAGRTFRDEEQKLTDRLDGTLAAPRDGSRP